MGLLAISPFEIHFLETMLSKVTAAPMPPLTLGALKRMDSLYGLSETKNAEVRVHPPHPTPPGHPTPRYRVTLFT